MPPDQDSPAETSPTRRAAAGYIADGELATAIALMQLLKRPLLLEGEAGVGKTEVAKALAAVHGDRADPAAMLRGARPVGGAL